MTVIKPEKNFLLHKFENKIVVEGTLKSLTALHIGSGKHTYSLQDADNTVIRSGRDHTPFIPGSSIKGVLRSYLEMLLASTDVYGKCCIVTENACLEPKAHKTYLREVKAKYKNEPEKLAEELYDKLCPICRLFGSQVVSSKIQIKDAMLTNKVPVETRDGIAMDRDTGTAAHGKKYNFECVSAGAEFSFLMTIDNVEPEYEKLVKMLIHALEDGELTLGGRKSIGLGEVQLINTKVYKVEKEQLMDYALKGLTEEMRWENV